MAKSTPGALVTSCAEPPGPGQELRGARRRYVRPVDVVLRRGGEDHGQADGVDAELVQLLAEVDAVAQGLAHGLAAVEHLALVQQRAEGLVGVDHAQVVDDLGEEPGVEQVQDGVLHAADVLADRHPVVDLRRIERAVGVLRGDEAQEVPGGIHEGVHRVRVPLGRAVAVGALDVDPASAAASGDVPFGDRSSPRRSRQRDGQLLVRDRDLAAGRAVDDRDRGAPEPLPAEQPVAQAEVHELLAGALLLQDFDGGRDGLRLGQPVQGAGVDQGALARGRRAGDGGVFLAGVQDGPDGQVKGPGEVEVALVVRRGRP